jgi:hypothetical protein
MSEPSCKWKNEMSACRRQSVAKAPAAAKHKASSARDVAFRKKMSERMKAAWAARKKKAAASGQFTATPAYPR